MKDSLDARYALALLSIAKEDNKVNQYQKELKEIKRTLDNNADLLNLLKSEFLSPEKRYQVIDNIFKSYSKVATNFLKILLQNHRLNSYPIIFNRFNSLCNEINHVLEGIIYSTEALSGDKIHEIEIALKNKHHVDVELSNRIDPSLIGGIKVVLDNHVYDYSIQSEIATLRSQLKI